MRDYTKIEAWPLARLPARRERNTAGGKTLQLGERVLLSDVEALRAGSGLGEKIADDLTVAVYEHTRMFPKDEMYGLTSQLRRASYSVPANIGSAP